MENRREELTPGQRKTLVGAGYSPDKIEGLTKGEASRIIARTATKNHGGLLRKKQASLAANLQKRIEIIQKRGLRVGMRIMANLRGGEARKLSGPHWIIHIANGYVRITGSGQYLHPSRVFPA